MYENIVNQIIEYLGNFNINANLAGYIVFFMVLIGLSILAYVSDIITKRIIIVVIDRFISKTKTTWDDVLKEKKVFHKLAHIAPALVIYFLAPVAFQGFSHFNNTIQVVTQIYMLVIIVLVISSLLNAAHEIYKTFPISNERPIFGFIQLLKIILYAVVVIAIVSMLFSLDFGRIITGLGAVAAVLILVFKDTILGFVASIQLSANQMVKIGDWISMPTRNADGTIEEITLNTVKVKNWDKTISTIPTYALVSESFANWRGMEESGGRRIKRHINIDMNSVKFCTEEMLQKFGRIRLLKEYIKNKRIELDQHNSKFDIDPDIKVNVRNLTNVGVFRKYLEEYLLQHPMIKTDMTFLVRQLQPTETGLPIEIYVFSADQRWAYYESIQSDIFDHILAVIPEFELRVYQSPSGDDFQKLLQ